MNSKLALIAILTLFGMAHTASADIIPSGEYTGKGDGSDMTMTVEGEKVSIFISATGCMGNAEGLYSAKDDKTWIARMTDGTGACEITITDDGTHYLINEGEGCSYFHGASCGFSGQVAK